MEHAEINKNSIQMFSKASLVFGILSILTFWTGFFPFICGSMGILCAILSKREAMTTPSASWWGTMTSAVGLLMGALILYFFVVSYLIPIMTDPALYQEWDTYYRNLYGIGLDEIFPFLK